jgi:putative aldouronate transport system permease protein
MTIGDWLNYSALALISFISIFPIFYVFTVSLTHPDSYVPFEFRFLPEKWSLASYAFILSTPSFINSLKSTVFVTVVGTVLNLVVTYTLAYGLTKRNVPGRKVFLNMVIITLIFNAGIVPNYILIKDLKLLNSLWSLILFELTNAWSLIVVMSFLESIPKELEESAMIDGENEMGVFWRIIVPLSGPSIAAFTLFFAVAHWNSYFNPLMFISDSQKWTLQVLVKTIVIDSESSGIGVAASNEYGRLPDETRRLASVMLAMAPILVLYPFLQRYFVRGVMVGAVKG